MIYRRSMSYVFAMFAIMVFLTTIVTLGSQNTFSAFAITQMPSVSITSPSNNTIVSAGNVTMTGTASSLNGINSVKVYTNGSFSMTATPKAIGDWSSWTATLYIPKSGTGTFMAKVTDNAGSQNQVSIQVTIADITKPAISFTSISNGTTIPIGNITLSGTSSDIGSGVKSVQIKIGSISYVATPLISSNNWSKWTFTQFMNKVGSNQIIAKVKDNAGLQNSISASITLVDKTPPTVSFGYPVNGTSVTNSLQSSNSIINTGNITITGTASDVGSGLKKIQVSTNGTLPIDVTPKAQGDWSTWSVVLPFSMPGKNTLTAKATDNSNNNKTVTELVSVVDKILPTISVYYPSNNFTIQTGNITVTGTASDVGSGIKSVQVKTSSGNYIVANPKSPGNWSTWYATVNILQPGQNFIMATVTDNGNNVQSVKIPINMVNKIKQTTKSVSFIAGIGNPALSTLEAQLKSGDYEFSFISPNYVTSGITSTNNLKSSFAQGVNVVTILGYNTIDNFTNNLPSISGGLNYIGYDYESGPGYSPEFTTNQTTSVGYFDQAQKAVKAYNTRTGSNAKLIVSLPYAELVNANWDYGIVAQHMNSITIQFQSMMNNKNTAIADINAAVTQIYNRSHNTQTFIQLSVNPAKATPLESMQVINATSNQQISSFLMDYSNTDITDISNFLKMNR